jgi:hypothetical protein
MKDQTTISKPQVFKYEANDDQWLESLNRRIGESKSFWDSKFKLSQVEKQNEALYLGHSTDDYDMEQKRPDNRIFSSIRTIVPYVTSRITEPEVMPSSNATESKKFAEDFEKALYAKAGEEKVKQKVKFALEDAIIRRRGYLKPRYDAQTGNFCTVEYVPAESIIVDHKARAYEEPRYFRHLLEKSVDDMLIMFPDKEKEIKEAFGLDDNTPRDKYEACYTVNEDWCFVPSSEGLDLIVTWSYKKMFLGKMQDPNWRYGKSNFLNYHMMPLVSINVLNDGRTHIDKTSFVEQSKDLQENVYERGRQISKNAGLGNTGMPVVDTAALADDQSQYLQFEEDTVLELEVPDGKRISDVFDVWKAGTMPQFVYEDKIDSRNSIDNAFGTPNVFRGEQSDNNTLGQDVLVRDQAFGRQQEIVDAIDSAMERLYLLMAQFLLVYGNEQELFRFTGENSQFDYVLINSENLDTNVQIRVKSGTSMPIDRAQRRAVADKAATQGMIDPLTYWEIMDEGNADKYAKRLVDYTQAPDKFMQDMDEEVFNRDAFVDIELIKQGSTPPFRKDLDREYFDYLNHWILNGNLDDPEIAPESKMAIQQFIDVQLERGQKMLGMAETQLPTPDEINAANEQTDQLNQQDQAAAEQDMKMQQASAKLASQADKSKEKKA